MKDHPENGERAVDATYEDESAKSRRTVTIPLKEYDEIKREEHIERLVRALRKHIIRK